MIPPGEFSWRRRPRSYRVILMGMKTAISVPDDTYERASKRAQHLGMSRSEFFSRAAARYLDELDSGSVTGQIDLAVDALAGEDGSAADAVSVGRRLLTGTADDW
jgi:predicted DNA-binding protein